MYGNVGLPTARGSGTNGYTQRNAGYLRPDRHRRVLEAAAKPAGPAVPEPLKLKASSELLDHAQKRAIEAKVFEERVRLEDAGVSEEEIEEKVRALREKLLGGSRAEGRRRRSGEGQRRTRT